MALINNGQILGTGSTDLILNTRGKIYVKVGDRFYELDFKNEGNNRESTIINNTTINNPEQDLSPYVTKKYLKAALGEYVTKRNWEDLMQTKEALENAQLEGFTESITPITVNTMQMVVGTQNLQFDFITSLKDATVVSPGLYINESGQLVCPRGFIKHYTLFGPESVKPETGIEYYARWTINGDNGGDYALLDLEEKDKPYYVYLRVNTTGYKDITDDDVTQNREADPKGQNTGDWFVSTQSHAIDELEGNAYLLVALITGSNSGGRSIGYLNGFTEILPGQITAYVFKTADGNQYLDFMNKRFMIGDDKTGYMKWDLNNGLQIKGKISVLPGGDIDDKFSDIEDRFTNMQVQIDGEVQCWFSTDAEHNYDIPLPNEDNKTSPPNWPALNWKLSSDQKAHLGDLYYVVADNPNTEINEKGQAYRYVKSDDKYYWVRVLDNSVSLALYNAYLAQQSADEANKILSNIADDNVITIQEHSQLEELYNSVISQYDQTMARANSYKAVTEVATAMTELTTAKEALSTQVNYILALTTTYTITNDYRNAWSNFFIKIKELNATIAAAAKSDIDNAVQLGQDTLDKFNNWASDNLLSAPEIIEIENELAFITSDYTELTYRAKLLSKESNKEYTDFKTAYNAYKKVLDDILAAWNNLEDKTECINVPINMSIALSDYYSKRADLIALLTVAVDDKIGAAAQLGTNALKKFEDWASDNKISPTEISEIKREFEFVESDFNDLTNKAKLVYATATDANAYLSNSLYTRYKANKDDYYSDLDTIIKAWNNRGEGVDTVSIPTDMSAHITAYYTARTNLIKDLAKKENDAIIAAAQLGTDALNKFKNWADDGSISAVEIDSIFDEMRFINSDYQDIHYRAIKWKANSESSPIYSQYTAYENAYNDYYTVLESIKTQWANRGSADFITLIPEFIQSWESAVTNYYDTRTNLLKGFTDLEGDSNLEYLKKALKEGKTDISGGLILTNLIALGFSLESDPESEYYYNSFRVMSGINGQMVQNALGKYDYTDPAIWFGGGMLDIENVDTLSNPETCVLLVQENNTEYNKYLKDSEIEKCLYKWRNEGQYSYYYSLAKSGQPFVNHLTTNPPLQPISPQPFGNRHQFDGFLECTIAPSVSFTDRSGNNWLLQGKIQAYRVGASVGPFTVYDINTQNTVSLTGTFHKYIVSSHSQVNQEGIVKLGGKSIFAYLPGGGPNIGGLIFTIGSNYYYVKCSATTQNKDGFLYVVPSQISDPIVSIYTSQGYETFPLYGWKDSNNNYLYTLTDYDEKPEYVYTLSGDGTPQYTTNYTIADYYTNWAKAMFRMDGSGYLANGNISWDTNGRLILGKGSMSIDPNGAIDLGYLHSDDLSFWIGNDEKKMLEVSNNRCKINGSLSTRAESYYDGSFISIEDSSGTNIIDIGSTPLSTAAIPTYLRQTESSNIIYKKGSALWGKVTIPNNWEYQITDWYTCYIGGEGYKLNNFNIHYEFARVSKSITLEIVLRKRDISTGEKDDSMSLFTKTFNVSTSTQSGKIVAADLGSLAKEGTQMEGFYQYSLVMKLSPGQVKSSIASDSWIYIQRGAYEVEITRSTAQMQIGTFIRPNGISSVFGQNSKFQWLGAMADDYTDYRDQGGTFIVALPATSEEGNATNVIGLELTGYMDSSAKGSGSTDTPGIRINLGDGWYKLRFDNNGILRKV